MATKKRKTKGSEDDLNGNPQLEEEMISMLKSEYGEDTEIVKLVDALEKKPEKDDASGTASKGDIEEEFRRCPECGLDTIFINQECPECGHSRKHGKKKKQIKVIDSDDSDFSGYNTDEDD